MDYENAGKFRDKIYAIKGIQTKQNVSNTTTENIDILGVSLGEEISCVQVYELRDKKIVGRENYILKGEHEKNTEEILSAFIKQFYTNTPFIPPLILVEKEINDKEILEELLSKLKGTKVKIKVPIKGEKKKLLDMAKENSKIHLENIVGKEKQKQLIKEYAIKEVNNYANINKTHSTRYEAYDISNISGSDSVGVMVVFNDTKPNYKAYRKFRIKTIEEQNDYGSMVEVVFRRLNRGIVEQQSKDPNPSFLPFPDVIFVDGGIGHVNAIKNVVDAFNLDIKVLGLGKNNKHQLKEVVKNKYEAKNVKEFDYAFKFLNDISEEVHRFAIDYHRNQRSKSFLKTTLEDINGIGKVKSKNLLKHFKNINEIKKASIEEIVSVQGMNEKLAKDLKDYLNND